MFNLLKHSQTASEVSSTLGDAASQLQEGYKDEVVPGTPVENTTDLNTLQQSVDTEEQKNLLERMGGLEAFNYFMDEMKLKYGPSVEAMKSQLLGMNGGNTLLNNFTEQGRVGLEQNIEDLGDFTGTASMVPRTEEVEIAKREIENTIQQHAIAMRNRAGMLAAASFNLKRHKKHSQVMPQPMGMPMEQPMGGIPMEQPMGGMPMEQPEQQIEGQSGRFPVENEGDFIAKFSEDLLATNNQPGTQEYERARMAAEEIRAAVSPGFEEEANSILESVMQLDVTQRDQASNYLMKLYEVLIPPMLKGDQAESQMEPVMSEKKQDAIEGIVRFSLTDSVLNNNKNAMMKTAADQFGQQYLLYGPTEKRICPKLRGKNLSVGDVVSEYTCRMHCIDGIAIDDNKTICGEALWRANAMDKYSREYVNKDGDIIGGYINKRFEVNRNVQEENKMRLKPGETRKPRPAAWGNTESRLQDMRSKEGQARDYRPETNTGDPFEWCHDVDQNNVEVSQAERDRREEAAGHKLVQYTNRDQAENNPKKGFNLKRFKTAQSIVDYKPMDTHQTAISPASNQAVDMGVTQPPNVSTDQGMDAGKPMAAPAAAPMASEDTESDVISRMSQQGFILVKENVPWGKTLEFKDDSGKVVYYDHGRMLTASQMADYLEKNWQDPVGGTQKQRLLNQMRALDTPSPGLPLEGMTAGFNLKRHKKEAECPVPHTTALPDHDYFRQNQPQDGHNPDVKPKKKT